MLVAGLTELGVVYPGAREQGLYGEEFQRIARSLKLRVSSIVGRGDLSELGRSLGPTAPAVLLFVGGTPELVPFSQGLARQSRQRYVVALADVNLQTVAQMGAARQMPLIATQVVPLAQSPLPLVRAYRDTLARLFDEPPTSLSLAGYVAARWVQALLADLESPTRASLLAAAQRRRAMDLGGFRIAFEGGNRGSSFVTQSMLTSDGRVLG